MKVTQASLTRYRLPSGKTRTEFADEAVPGLRWYVGRRGIVAKLDKTEHGVKVYCKHPVGKFNPEDPNSLNTIRGKAMTLVCDPQSSKTTFRELAEKYKQMVLPKFASGKLQERIIDTVLLSAWGNMPLEKLHKKHLNSITDEIAPDHPHKAVKVQQVARAMLAWHEKREGMENPFAVLAPAADSVKRKRVLDDKELAAIWDAAETLNPTWKAFVRFLMASGQRRTEVARMRWSEVEGGIWTIPTERIKSKREHVVPLSQLLRDILDKMREDMRKANGEEKPPPRIGYVFSHDGGATPISGYSPIKKKLEDEAGVEGWRFHDFRRTCSTRMMKQPPKKKGDPPGLGIAPHIVSSVLNHSLKGVTHGHYDGNAYTEEVGEALQAYGEHLRSIFDPSPIDNVIQLHG